MSSRMGLQQRRKPKNDDAAVIKQDDDEQETAPVLHGYSLTPLRQRAWWARLDVWPFVVMYLTCVWLEKQQGTNSSWMKTLLLPILMLMHIILAVWQQWSVQVACRVGYVKASSQPWTHCLVETSGESAIQDIQHHDGNVAVVDFQHVVFRYDPQDTMDTLWNVNKKTTTCFCRLRYPIDFSLQFYEKEWSGHQTLESIRSSEAVYGGNTTNLLLPSLTELLGQQLLAPFFLFQLFCVVLWSLDEYWYYALFTLMALLMFETTVAYNRRHGLERLRSSMRHAQHVHVFRINKWMVISSHELVPGDVVSLSTSARTMKGPPHVPADMLLLQGSAVVDEALLTGESVPQIKTPIEGEPDEVLNVEEHKQSVLFGGTMLVSHTAASSNNNSITKPPDGGVVAFVLRTGFETAQGSLLRTMAHSKSADGIHTRDTLVFVAMLLACAIVSALVVLHRAWHDETRNRFRLILHVIIIITSVVPPELPMELSLAVTNSVADLMHKCRVYCTEPFRIPWAGRVDTCCFDKTGTLTSDEMELKGVRLSGVDGLVQPGEAPWNTVRVMAACHSLAWTSDRKRGVIGDPLEAAVLRDTGYQVHRNDTVVATAAKAVPQKIIIQQRFAFSSRLKRMTVLVTEDSSKTVWALTKGAPETIKTLLKTVPDDYEQVYTYHMAHGQRVLAMGYRKFDNQSVSVLKDEGREYVEQDLEFAGFIVLDCPLKSDSKSVITELRKSGHTNVMITGDAVLTAGHVARQVGIIRKKVKVTYELQERTDEDKVDENAGALSRFIFVPLATRKSKKAATESISASNLSTIQGMIANDEASFCVSGTVLTKLAVAAVQVSQDHSPHAVDEMTVLMHPAAQAALMDFCPLISVFARHAPRQKEAVVAAFNLSGRYTLMCGDGTNDVGALKRAHVGISIISAPDLEAKQRDATAALGKKNKASTLEASLRKLQEAQDELDHVELGDASVASPFTSRAMSIKCCKDVLQQGRCTLVTMLQIYKILGVNCLVNALVLTKLHMHGVKQGDRQLTILGLAVAAMFFFVTRGKPLPTLSPHRPPSSVLCAQALLSIAAQFLVHLAAILIATDAALAFVDPYDPSIIPDGSFNPNVLNTCTFLLTMVATVNTFVVNYKGRPFMEDFHENKLLLRSVQVCHAVLLICALEIFPPLNDLLQLAPFPSTDMGVSTDDDWVASVAQAGGLTGLVRSLGFPAFMFLLMTADTAIAYGVEKAIARYFND